MDKNRPTNLLCSGDKSDRNQSARNQMLQSVNSGAVRDIPVGKVSRLSGETDSHFEEVNKLSGIINATDDFQ